MLDEEKEQRLSAARATEPRTTDDYNYTNYHNGDEVSTQSHSQDHLFLLISYYNVWHNTVITIISALF